MSTKLVVLGAQLTCTMGTTPSALSPTPRVADADAQMAATVMDFAPNVNIPPFGLCNTPTNPTVAAATAAAAGVLTPQPCIPVVTAPWAPGSPAVDIDGQPALSDDSTCTCAWAGVISIVKLPSGVDLD